MPLDAVLYAYRRQAAYLDGGGQIVTPDELAYQIQRTLQRKSDAELLRRPPFRWGLGDAARINEALRIGAVGGLDEQAGARLLQAAGVIQAEDGAIASAPAQVR